MSQSYKLTANSIRSINRTILAVNKMRPNGASGDLPFLQNQKRQASGPTLQIGKTTGNWTKGFTQRVNLYSTADRTQIFEPDGTPKTVSVFNLFADVGNDKWVAFMNGILIAAECDEE